VVLQPMRRVDCPDWALVGQRDALAEGIMIQAAEIESFAMPNHSVRIPDHVMGKALARRAGLAKQAERLRRSRAYVGVYAAQAVTHVISHLHLKQLEIVDDARHAFENLSDESPVEPDTHRASAVVVLLEYEPSLSGRLKSRLARLIADDPHFLSEVQSEIFRRLVAEGYQIRFHTHLVQRFVEAGTSGYYETEKVQLLGALVWA
jgi:hypothetical protein